MGKFIYEVIFITVLLTFPINVFCQSPNILWQNSIGGLTEDNLSLFLETEDSGYVLAGSSTSMISGDKTVANNLYNDYWIVRVDSLSIIEWQNAIGGNGNDILMSIIATSDGGYFLGGYSDSGISGDKTEVNLGDDDFWVLKLDSVGQNTIGGNSIDELYTAKQTSDGGYILGGESISDSSYDKSENNKGYSDCWVVKLDSIGNIMWENSYGGGGTEHLFSLDLTNDGGFILGASSHSGITEDKSEIAVGADDYWIIKLDAFGNIIWDNTIGGNSWDFVKSIVTTEDNNYIVLGYSKSGIFGDKTEASVEDDYWLLKLDSTGNILWQQTIGGSASDIGCSISFKDNGNFLIGGYSFSGISGDKTDSLRGDTDFWILELDTLGNILWDKTLGGDGKDLIGNFIETNDGGYMVGGAGYCNLTGDITDPGNGSTDYWLIKLCGDITNIIDSLCENTSYILPDGSITYEPGEYTVILTNIMGCDSVINITLNTHQVDPSIYIDDETLFASDTGALEYHWMDCSNKELIEGADTYFYSPTFSGSYALIITDAYNCVDTSDCYSIIVDDITTGKLPNKLIIYPNPASNYLIIEINDELINAKVEIMNIEGKLISTSSLSSIKTKIQISDFSKGIYYLRIIKSDRINTGIVILN